MNLRLLGAPTIKDIVPEMVDASNISSHASVVPGDRLYETNCTFSRCLLAARSVDKAIDESMQHARLRELNSKL